MLEDYGWTPDVAEKFEELAREGAEAARVIEEYRGGFVLRTAAAEVAGESSGRLWNEAQEGGPLPAIGDWVAVRAPEGEGPFLIEAVLPRRSVLRRNAAGRETREQVIGANVDTAFLLSPADRALRGSAVERYLTMLWESGAVPVVLVTKTDLAEDLGGLLAEAAGAALGAEVLGLSAVTGEGLSALEPYLRPGETVCFVGPSGAGKSTLLNRLAGEAVQEVQEVRSGDAKGRHTTTHRQLFRLPSGVLAVDTPGMRELQLWDGAEEVEDVFADIEALAASCRFRDCAHEGEPGCAVEERADPRRLESWRKQKLELAKQERRRSAAKAKASKQRWKKVTEDYRERRKFEGR